MAPLLRLIAFNVLCLLIAGVNGCAPLPNRQIEILNPNTNNAGHRGRIATTPISITTGFPHEDTQEVPANGHATFVGYNAPQPNYNNQNQIPSTLFRTDDRRPAISTSRRPLVSSGVFHHSVRNVSSIVVSPRGLNNPNQNPGYYYDNYDSPLSTENQFCPPQNPQANKALVTEFYQRTFGDKNLEGLERYLRVDYIQHNPLVADGIKGFREFLLSPLIRNQPKSKIDIRRVSAEDDLVWVHVKLVIASKNYAVVDIFRIQCGLIAEHWDVIQEMTQRILRTAKNSHPFF